MFITLIAVLLGMLAACSKPAQQPTGSKPLVEINITLAGAPLQPSGQLELTHVTIQVQDDKGAPAHFNKNNVIDPQGEQPHLSVPADETSITLYLHEGTTWSFTGHAFDTDDHLLAAATTQHTTTSSNNANTLRFKSLLGIATLQTRLPTRQVMPGQEIDLLLNITPRERPDLRVPPSDYQATYETSNATSLNYSERGIRLRAGDRSAGDVVVTGTAAGLLYSNGEAVPGEISTTLSLPFSSGISVDLDPPEISKLAFDAEQQIFTGVADDDHSIVKLELYDGPVMLASSDLEAMSEKSVPEVIFPGGGTAFYTQIDLPAGAYTLTVVATDFSGNDTRAKHEVTVP